MHIAELVLRRSGEGPLHFRLQRAETTIGSHATNDVVVPDAGVAEHAAVLVDRGSARFELRALATQVTLNGAPVEGTATLGAGDRVGLGRLTLELGVRADTAAPRRTKVRGADAQHQRAAVLQLEGRSLRLDPNGDRGFTFAVGSDADNDLVLDDDFVSSFHLRFTCPDGRWTLTDLDSTNGTVVNGLRVGETELPSPAAIQIGQVRLGFEIEAEDEEGIEAPGVAQFAGMLAQDRQMKRVFALIRRFADVDAPVLVTGESGSGKELVARALHDESSRRAGPFVALNCGALAPTLIEAELFGHVKGAFTGANEHKKGAFEAAGHGTLFLDEIGELPLELQPKLLRALESKTVRKVGGASEIPFDARIVAATHRNLQERVAEGAFREDLFHRLFVLRIAVPSLFDREDDILPLADFFLESQAPGQGYALTAEAKDRLRRYGWPGNVRELRNVILRAVLMTDGRMIDAGDLEFMENAFRAAPKSKRVREVDEDEREELLRVLKAHAGNRAEAARALGVSKSTFHDRLKRLNIPNKFSRR